MRKAHDGAVREMLARDEIRQLPYRYAAAIEARDVEAMVELFSAESRFGDHGSGSDGLRTLMSDSLDDSLFAVILVANHLVEFDGDAVAHGQVWAHCFAQTAADGFVEQLIRYEDRYVLENDRWVFLHRKHRLWFGVGHESSPLDQKPAEWPARQIGVGDIPLADPKFCEWWVSKGDR